MNKYDLWVKKEDLDVKLRKQLVAYNDQEKEDAFYTDIAFGTAGMRGLLGAGPNRMNVYTVGRANLGYGKYLLSLENNPKCAIAYDNRHMSKEFATLCANQLSEMGIEVYVFDSLRPTPELSFTVRELQCTGGIVITASHNPKEYNGYKVYDDTGCQLVPERINKVIELIGEVESELDVTKPVGNPSLIHWINEEMDIPYKEALKSIQLRPELNKSQIKIVFTPQHGTAYPLMSQVFEELDYRVNLVGSQLSPDPDFSNTLTPNPEEKESYEEAIVIAKEVDADLVLSTDPDADRMGIVVKHEGDYHYLSGNQGGVILLEYILSTLKEQGKLSAKGVVFNTVVTSDSGEQVAKKYGIKTEKTLTGFKYIGTKIAEIDQGRDAEYLFGYEESYGYLIKPFVRDKDALQACLMVAEAAVYSESQNKTLIDVLNEVYDEIGYYLETQDSLVLEGASGATLLQEVMNTFRNLRPETLANVDVVYFEDYLAQKRYEDERSFNMPYPAENVLKYGMADGSWIAIRPSGTEPKCKFYYCVKAKTKEDAQVKLKDYQEVIQSIIEGA